MRLLKLWLTPWILICSCVTSDEAQLPLASTQEALVNKPALEPFRVAIIGAGAAGSSAAYHLRDWSFVDQNTSIALYDTSPAINITLFESSSRVGGRTTTVNALNDPRYPVELGASIFVEVNYILTNAAKEFGLLTTDPYPAWSKPPSLYSLGVWDGSTFTFRQTAKSSSWWDITKLLWQYGLAPIKTQRLMKNTVARFLKMYEQPIFPFKSLSDAVMRVGLLESTSATGTQILQKEGIGERFGREIIQASTRVNYGQNLPVIHGLETMVCMATDGAVAVEGGNWQIFDRMVKASRADVRLNTAVSRVAKSESGNFVLTFSNEASPGAETRASKEDFDAVILASPYQFSNISFDYPLYKTPDKIPYVLLYVTLFTTPHRLSPAFFNLASAEDIPDMVLTSLPADLDLGAGNLENQVGPSGFWSVNMQRAIEVDGTTQYLYKVFSPRKLTGTWLAKLLGVEHKITTSSGSGLGSESITDEDDAISAISSSDLSWSYEKSWHSYPYELPRVTFENIRLDPEGATVENSGRSARTGGRGIWYTSGIESFISTMETSALMGKNVARLMLEELLKGNENDAVM